MDNQLLEEPIAKIYDSGYRALSLDNSGKNNSLSLKSIDFDQLLEQKNPKKAIQALEPLEIYHALMERGLEDCLEIIPLLSSEQITRIFDYDIWQEDRLVAKQAFQWLKLFGEVGTKELYERFKGLDEEYQLAIMGPYIRIFDEEEFEKLTDDHQDRLTPLPSNEAYYEVISDDYEIQRGIEDLIQSIMAHNMAYAISLLAHAAFIPPNEQEFDAFRFRKARIEEDGFVAYEESQNTFIPVKGNNIRKKYQKLANPDNKPAIFTGSKLFLDLTLEKAAQNQWSEEELNRVQTAFVYLANNLCSASKIETDDMHGLKIILKHAKSIVSLGLEYLSGLDTEVAAQVLLQEYPKKVFQIGLNLLHELRDSCLESLKIVDHKAVIELVRQNRYGAAQDYIDRYWLEKLGFNLSETIKGLCNRYPVMPKFHDEANHKVVFTPISSLKDLSTFAEQLQNISGMVYANENKLSFVDTDEESTK